MVKRNIIIGFIIVLVVSAVNAFLNNWENNIEKSSRIECAKTDSLFTAVLADFKKSVDSIGIPYENFNQVLTEYRRDSIIYNDSSLVYGVIDFTLKTDSTFKFDESNSDIMHLIIMRQTLVAIDTRLNGLIEYNKNSCSWLEGMSFYFHSRAPYIRKSEVL